MAENEIRLTVELGIGILSGGKLSAKLRRNWAFRAAAYKGQLLEQSGLRLEQIEDACSER